jgi:hypothetical protein
MNIKGILFVGAEAAILFLIIAIITGIIGFVVYWLSMLLQRYLFKKGYIKVEIKQTLKLIIIILTICISTYFTYDAFYPSNAFYLNEYRKITLREAPRTANILRKSSSYPDMHGDYGACALIRLSKQDYEILYKEIQDDKNMKPGEIIGSEEFSDVMKGININEIKAGYIRPIGKEDHYLYIGFLKDNQTILIHFQST